MKPILASLLACGICLTPATVTLTSQPSWAQTQDRERLLEQAAQYKFS